jgi:hypothetical protein
MPIYPYMGSLSSAVGLLYAILAGLLYVIAFLRARHAREEIAAQDADMDADAVRTAGQDAGRHFGRPFVTAGDFVIAVTASVAAIELALFVNVLIL